MVANESPADCARRQYGYETGFLFDYDELKDENISPWRDVGCWVVMESPANDAIRKLPVPQWALASGVTRFST